MAKSSELRGPVMSKFASGSIALALFFCGCVHLNSVSQTQIPANRSHKVSAEASRFIVFFFNFDNDYIDSMNESLRRSCEGGRVTGILTKDETTNYFLGFLAPYFERLLKRPLTPCKSRVPRMIW